MAVTPPLSDSLTLTLWMRRRSQPHSLRGPAHVDARRGRVRPLGDGEVHPDLAVVDLDAVAVLLGPLGVVDVLEVDEGEAAGASRLGKRQASGAAVRGAAELTPAATSTATPQLTRH